MGCRADAVAATGLKLDARTIVKLEEPYHPKPVAGRREGQGIRDAEMERTYAVT